MNTDKSQGQTIERIGLDLREDVFTHGQLYVALSRARSWNNIRILSNDEHTMKNVVFPGALLPVPPDPLLNEKPPPQPPDHQHGLPDDVDEEEVEQEAFKQLRGPATKHVILFAPLCHIRPLSMLWKGSREKMASYSVCAGMSRDPVFRVLC